MIHTLDRFNIQTNPYIAGFNHYVTLKLDESIDEQLCRWRIDYGYEYDDDTYTIQRVIIRNLSLGINFGWSLGSEKHFEQIMKECIETVASKYSYDFGTMISDTRCSWLGFVQFNIFEKIEYEDLDKMEQIDFNNQLIEYQIEVVKFVTQHKIFLQHSLLRDDSYRFKYFKIKRKDRDLLYDAYHYYIDAIKEVGMISKIPRQLVEEQIGCHYLHHPDLFFELLEFSILKGNIE